MHELLGIPLHEHLQMLTHISRLGDPIINEHHNIYKITILVSITFTHIDRHKDQKKSWK
jgi:hypothetical protein